MAKCSGFIILEKFEFRNKFDKNELKSKSIADQFLPNNSVSKTLLLSSMLFSEYLRKISSLLFKFMNLRTTMKNLKCPQQSHTSKRSTELYFESSSDEILRGNKLLT